MKSSLRSTHSSRAVLDRINAYQMARREGFPEGWRCYRLTRGTTDGTVIFAPGTWAAWRSLLWKWLGDAALMGLFVVAGWAILAGSGR